MLFFVNIFSHYFCDIIQDLKGLNEIKKHRSIDPNLKTLKLRGVSF